MISYTTAISRNVAKQEVAQDRMTRQGFVCSGWDGIVSSSKKKHATAFLIWSN